MYPDGIVGIVSAADSPLPALTLAIPRGDSGGHFYDRARVVRRNSAVSQNTASPLMRDLKISGAKIRAHARETERETLDVARRQRARRVNSDFRINQAVSSNI